MKTNKIIHTFIVRCVLFKNQNKIHLLVSSADEDVLTSVTLTAGSLLLACVNCGTFNIVCRRSFVSSLLFTSSRFVSNVNFEFETAVFLFSFRFRFSNAGSRPVEFFITSGLLSSNLRFTAVLLLTDGATASSRRSLRAEMTSQSATGLTC